MPGKRRKYLLTETAEKDFREAKRWSTSRWGKALTQEYFTDLHKTAERLADNTATSGRLFKDGELSIHPVREHYLVYVAISPGTIAIVALIRQTRDVPAILNANGYLIHRQLKALRKAVS